MLTRLKSKLSRSRCPLCHEALVGEPYHCDGCETTYHSECVTEFGGCGTLGCAHAGVAPEEEFTERLSRWRRERARRQEGVERKLEGVREHFKRKRESIRRRRVEIEEQRNLYWGRRSGERPVERSASDEQSAAAMMVLGLCLLFVSYCFTHPSEDTPAGGVYLFALLGAFYLVWGGIYLWRARVRKAPDDS